MKKTNTCLVIVSPSYKIIGPNLTDLIRILVLCGMKRVYLISGPIKVAKLDQLTHIKLENQVLLKKVDNVFAKLAIYLLGQLLLVVNLSKLADDIDTVISYQSESTLTIVLARLLRKKVLVYVGGSGYYSMHSRSKIEKVLSILMLFLENLMFKLAHKIIVISDAILSIPYISLYKNKIVTAPTRMLDEKFFQRFFPKMKYEKRKKILGYVGRFEGEKGVLELIDAMKYVYVKLQDAEFLLVGDGSLKDEVIRRIRKNGLLERTSILGWVDNPEDYLNEIKLLLLPSFTEGLPNIILEAMACGTPVLATPVGAVPNIIRDNENGFLLKSNNPKHIAKRIIQLLNETEVLEKVSSNAYRFIKDNFSYEKTLETWRKILSELIE